MKTEILYRSAVFDQSKIDVENRRAIVAFSSEAEVQRSFGIEILSHKPEDVDMSFIASGNAPLLLEHEEEDQIGIVEQAYIENGVGRAVVRFSKSPDGEEVWQDVVDGIRKNISVGYAITERNVDRSQPIPIVTCKWRPMEISIVAIPADESVGIGRAAEIETAENKEEQLKETIEMENTQTTQTEVETRAFDIEAVKSEVRNAEIKRAAEITELAARHGVQSVGTEFVRSGKSVDEFRAAVLDTLAARPTVSTATTDIGLSDKELRSYSLGRAVQALVTGDFSEAGLEMEASRAAAKAAGKMHSRSSIFVPGEYLTRAAGANAVTATGNPALVNNTKIGFMDVLFNKSIAAKLGVQYMGGLNGTVEIPKFTSAVQARFVDEGEDGTVDPVTSAVVELKQRTLVALAELTRSMVLNGTAMEARINAQLQKAIAQKLDQEVFAKILANTGIDWITTPVGGIDYAALRALILSVENNNALTDNAKFAFNPSVGNLLSTTEKDSNTVGIYLRDDNGNVAGYASESSVNVGSNIIFGDFAEVTVGSWSTLELAVDTSQKFASGGFLLRALVDADVAVTRDESFAGYKAVL